HLAAEGFDKDFFLHGFKRRSCSWTEGHGRSDGKRVPAGSQRRFGEIRMVFLSIFPAFLHCLQRFSPSFKSELLSFFKVSYHITQPSPESVAKGHVTGSLHPAKVRFSCWFRLFFP